MRSRQLNWLFSLLLGALLTGCGSSDEDTTSGAEPSPTAGNGGSGGKAAGGGAGAAGLGGNAGAAGSSGAAAGSSGTGGVAGSSGAGGGGGDGGGGGGGDGGDGGSGGGGGSGGDAGSSGVGGSGGSSGAAGASGAAGTGGAAGSAGSGGAACSVLCGALGVCCSEGEECISSACVKACDSGVHCGATCCEAAQACIAGECVTPTTSCIDSVDCNASELCEPTIGKCVGVPAGVSLCEYKSPTLEFAPALKWSWTSSAIQPTAVGIQSTPIVGDIDKDGVPDVLVITFVVNSAPGYLRALDGKTGLEKWPATADVYKAENVLKPATTPAIADLDSDGEVEILAAALGGGFIAFRPDGSVKWRSTNPDGSPSTFKIPYLASFSVARMDADDQAEIVLGGEAFDAKGKQITPGGYETAGMNGPVYGPDTLIADVDGDGVQDIVSGTIARKLDGTILYDNKQPDGYNALADLDGDGEPEVIVTSLGSVRVQNAKTGAVLASLPIPGGGTSGGPPTVADFDADGVMDFSAAGSNFYSVFSYSSKPSPVIGVKWSSPTQDLSPGTTGSSVFDFDGDGAAEVMYNDECFLRVYDGKTGKTLWEVPNSSLTGVEHPIAVDVDGDDHTDLVVTSANTCSTPTPQGVFVYTDPQNRWARTRRVWNQHTYHITNINADLSLPGPELASWKKDQGGFNNYRVSAQGRPTATDLQLDLEVQLSECPDTLVLRARVRNQGALGVSAGVDVVFYSGTDATGALLGEGKTTLAIPPGGSEVVELSVPGGSLSELYSFFAQVDPADAVPECVEDNNSASIGGVTCGKQ